MSLKLSIILLIISIIVCCGARKKLEKVSEKSEKQLFYESRETSAPNFIRLLAMR